ncbi:MAG TPA: FliA/WhiG family RNA polymerase sigma factor [Blastocatellia bacterium]|nr:FliA/WhiG family RNA polymerase sigma factor [Blastocatellia bacterium]
MEKTSFHKDATTISSHPDFPHGPSLNGPSLDRVDQAVTLKKRDALVTDNLRIVSLVLRRLLPKIPHSVEADDLWSAGVIGLIDAAQKYDSTRAARFRTYAEVRVHGAILDYLRSLSWAPRGLHRRRREMETARSAVENRMGRSVTESELAEEMGLTIEEQRDMRVLIERLDLDEADAICEEEHARRHQTSELDDPLLRIQRKEMIALLGRAIAALPQRQQLVLWLYYYEELTMKEVGAVLEVNEARVSQLHSKAIAALRRQIR